ncbi:hypothetical protein AVEN_245540-1 [Araneus ventricosus]|uniref:Uncharacterized protein n=1 Tax=Araneus ventricosus TaxID=182803 RepID=A0A4Y2JVZ8_ARAVE|nr:hypothetical protein AVEN_245540-1 [Araneus ventricosus]
MRQNTSQKEMLVYYICKYTRCDCCFWVAIAYTNSLMGYFIEKLQLPFYELGQKGWTSNTTKRFPLCIAADEWWSLPYCHNSGKYVKYRENTRLQSSKCKNWGLYLNYFPECHRIQL